MHDMLFYAPKSRKDSLLLPQYYHDAYGRNLSVLSTACSGPILAAHAQLAHELCSLYPHRAVHLSIHGLKRAERTWLHKPELALELARTSTTGEGREA